MPEPKHSIKKATIELEISNQSKAQDLQQRAGNIFHHSLARLIDQISSKYSAENVLHRIDKLEIDLGKISTVKFEAELKEKLSQELHLLLGTIIKDLNDNTGKNQDLTQSKLELLFTFIKTGSLPWWADAKNEKLLSETVNFLVKESPLAFKAELTKLQSQQSATLRLINHLLSEDLELLTKCLYPNNPLPNFSTGILSALRQEFSFSDKKRHKIHWLIVFENLMSKQSDKNTLSNILQRCQHELSITKKQLQRAINQNLSTIKQNVTTHEKRLVLELEQYLKNLSLHREDQKQKPEETFLQKSKHKDEEDEEAELLKKLLSKPEVKTSLKKIEEYISSELPKPSPTIQALKYFSQEKGFSNEIRTHSEQLNNRLGIYNQQFEDFCDQLNSVLSFSKEEVIRIIKSPSIVLQVITTSIETETLKDTLLNQFNQLIKSSKIIKAELSTLRKQLSQTNKSQEVKPATQGNNKTNTNSKQAKKQFKKSNLQNKQQQTQPSSQDNEIFVLNSGLIILAPFIKYLFIALEYMEGVEFVSEEKQHRAVQILQYLCAPQQSIQEYQMPLTKILCGLPPSEFVETEFEPTEREASQCEDLLKIVIERAEVFRKLSNNGFRSSFLWREAKLSAQGSHWLLQVDKKTHDILLDKIPWNYKMIKLSWMSSVLQVDW